MSKLTDGERLVKLETRVEDVIKGIDDIKRDNKEFRERLEKLLPTFATEDFVLVIKKDLQKEIAQTKASRLKDLTIQALVIGPISALIGFFFATVTK